MSADEELLQPVDGITKVRCFRCSHHVGEANQRLYLAAVIRSRERDLIDLVKPPRLSWKCKCGWTSVFKPA